MEWTPQEDVGIIRHYLVEGYYGGTQRPLPEIQERMAIILAHPNRGFTPGGEPDLPLAVVGTHFRYRQPESPLENLCLANTLVLIYGKPSTIYFSPILVRGIFNQQSYTFRVPINDSAVIPCLLPLFGLRALYLELQKTVEQEGSYSFQNCCSV